MYVFTVHMLCAYAMYVCYVHLHCKYVKYIFTLQTYYTTYVLYTHCYLVTWHAAYSHQYHRPTQGAMTDDAVKHESRTKNRKHAALFIKK